MPLTSKRQKVKKSEDVSGKSEEKPKGVLFESLIFHILPTNFGSTRLNLFTKQIERNSGTIIPDLTTCDTTNINYIIVEDSLDTDKIERLIDVTSFSSDTSIVRCTWISRCLQQKVLCDVNEDEKVQLSRRFKTPNNNNNNNTLINSTSKLESEDASKSNIIKEESTILLNYSEIASCSSLQENKTTTNKNKFQEKFVCAHSSNTSPVNVNKHITDELEKLQSTYKSKNDTWRALGYQKAIAAIRNYSQEITNWEQAKNIRGVGERLADKVMEIVESGKLRKVAEVCEGEEAKTLKLFMGVWGAGPTAAHMWYIQGYRTLEDLRTKASLSKHQEIGLRYYEDINSRIPRAEAAEIEDCVREAALKIQPGLEVVVCGSYRRGHPTCGDVDVLVTHPDGASHGNVFKPLLQYLHSTGFITDDLVIQQNGNQCKYLGVCQLPKEGSKHRRLDIIIVPYKEFAPALLYFTGSAHFNRSMRLLATKMRMSLSEHGLKSNIVRQGREKLNEGIYLDTPSEESIFEHLGLKYRKPSERDH